MIVTFEPPHIDAATPESQIAQIKSYLTLLSEKLNFVMETLEEAEEKIK
ncbi:MAG: hypothetical protein U0M08_00375 [Clostridia bacterium]|nr:hypothetical protein [Clostridia bacterium]